VCARALAEYLGEEWLDVLALIFTQLGLCAQESHFSVQEIRLGLSSVVFGNRLLGVGFDVPLVHLLYDRGSLLDCG